MGSCDILASQETDPQVGSDCPAMSGAAYLEMKRFSMHDVLLRHYQRPEPAGRLGRNIDEQERSIVFGGEETSDG